MWRHESITLALVSPAAALPPAARDPESAFINCLEARRRNFSFRSTPLRPDGLTEKMSRFLPAWCLPPGGLTKSGRRPEDDRPTDQQRERAWSPPSLLKPRAFVVRATIQKMTENRIQIDGAPGFVAHQAEICNAPDPRPPALPCQVNYISNRHISRQQQMRLSRPTSRPPGL